jgi:DNA integrity scanning protein DisA with diadenylate cyclase activity
MEPDIHSKESKTPRPASRSAEKVTDSLLRHVGPIAEDCDATAIFVYVDALDSEPLSLPESLKDKVCYVTKTVSEDRIQEDRGERFLRVPNVPLTRTGQVKMAVFLALSRGMVKRGDKIVFLSGLAASGNLDTILVTEVGREYEIFAVSEDQAGAEAPSHILPEVIDRVIEIASELGIEGREGKPVGTLFVVGDTDKVLPLTRQLILNPFKGYPEDSRNILDYSLEETIKELASIDGAFIIRGDGVIVSCGTYLKTVGQEEFELPQGLGTRHHAAAAITSLTESISVTVSESTGTVTIFRRGAIMTEIEKPRHIGYVQRAAPSKKGKDPASEED